MLSHIGRLILFLSSYTPLFVVLGIKATAHNFGLAVGLIALGILSGIAMLGLLKWARTITPTPVHVASSSSGSGDVIAYLFTYIVPFVGSATSTTADVISLLVLFVTIGLVFVNSDLGLVNPLLAGAGFHLHKVETDGRRQYLVLSRSDLPPIAGGDLRVRRLGEAMGLEA